MHNLRFFIFHILEIFDQTSENPYQKFSSGKSSVGKMLTASKSKRISLILDIKNLTVTSH